MCECTASGLWKRNMVLFASKPPFLQLFILLDLKTNWHSDVPTSASLLPLPFLVLCLHTHTLLSASDENTAIFLHSRIPWARWEFILFIFFHAENVDAAALSFSTSSAVLVLQLCAQNVLVAPAVRPECPRSFSSALSGSEAGQRSSASLVGLSCSSASKTVASPPLFYYSIMTLTFLRNASKVASRIYPDPDLPDLFPHDEVQIAAFGHECHDVNRGVSYVTWIGGMCYIHERCDMNRGVCVCVLYTWMSWHE